VERSPLKIPQLKEPQIILPTFSLPEVKLLVSWETKGFYKRRLHLLVCVLFDTVARVSEILGLHVSDCDLDDLLVNLTGRVRNKGGFRSALNCGKSWGDVSQVSSTFSVVSHFSAIARWLSQAEHVRQRRNP
jgi:site-specific recombinase XerC